MPRFNLQINILLKLYLKMLRIFARENPKHVLYVLAFLIYLLGMPHFHDLSKMGSSHPDVQGAILGFYAILLLMPYPMKNRMAQDSSFLEKIGRQRHRIVLRNLKRVPFILFAIYFFYYLAKGREFNPLTFVISVGVCYFLGLAIHRILLNLSQKDKTKEKKSMVDWISRFVPQSPTWALVRLQNTQSLEARQDLAVYTMMFFFGLLTAGLAMVSTPDISIFITAIPFLLANTLVCSVDLDGRELLIQLREDWKIWWRRANQINFFLLNLILLLLCGVILYFFFERSLVSIGILAAVIIPASMFLTLLIGELRMLYGSLATRMIWLVPMLMLPLIIPIVLIYLYRQNNVRN